MKNILSFLFLFLLFSSYELLSQSLQTDTYYTIRNRATGKVMDVSGKIVGEYDKNDVLMTAYAGTNEQKFRLVEDGDCYKLELAAAAKKCLQTPFGELPSAEAQMTVGTMTNATTMYKNAQRFIIKVASGSYYNIINEASGRNLKDSNGKLILEYPQSNGSSAETQWEFVEILPYGHASGIAASQIGYRVKDKKKAVYLDDFSPSSTEYKIVNARNATVISGQMQSYGDKWGKRTYTIDFTGLETPGEYRIVSNDFTSYPFYIGNDVWKNKTRHKEYLSNFMAFQRWKASVPEAATDQAVTGYEVTQWDIVAPIKHPNIVRDVRYGWFSATSKDKHVTENSQVVNNFLHAYIYHPDFWDDNKIDGVPAVLAEARYGLDFLLNMQDTDGGSFASVHPARAWFQDEIVPDERFLVINKCTGITARTASSFALGYQVFKDIDTEYAQKLLHAARKAFEWIEKNPDQYLPDNIRPPYWHGRFDNRLHAAAEMYIAMKDEYPEEAKAHKDFLETHINNGTMSEKGIWNSHGAGRDYDPNPYWADDQLLVGDIVFALTRYLPYAETATQTKSINDLNRFAAYWKDKDRVKNPYGWAEKWMVPWFGSCGYFAQVASKYIFAGYCIKDAGLIQLGKDHLQVVYGVNPFLKTYIYGEGENMFKDIFGREPHDQTSIGAILPGIKITNSDDGKIPDIPIDDYRIQGPDYSTGESCVPYTPALMLGMALLDRGLYFDGTSSLPSVKAERNTVILYPNPVTSGEPFRIHCPGNEGEEIMVLVTDLNGKVMLKEKYARQEIKVNSSMLEKGVYLVVVEAQGEKMTTGKLIVK